MLIILSISLIGLSSDVYAHPGNTDSSGGHTCISNCESWSLGYGEYHNGNYIEPNYFEQGSEAGAEHVDVNSTYITTRAESDGSSQGTNDGESGDSEDDSPDANEFCSDVNFENKTSPQDFYDGFMDTYQDECLDLYNERYSEAYRTAYIAGTDKYQATIASQNELDSESTATEKDTSNWSGLLWTAAIVTLFIVIGNWGTIKKWWADF